MSNTRVLQDFQVMNQVNGKSKSHRMYKVVLTGGPCGGKTTGQARLCTFFENLGWKVFRVPETATVLLSGGINQIAAIGGNGLNIYYDLGDPANAYLGGQTYTLTGGGSISPVPEPGVLLLGVMAMAGLFTRRRTRRRS